MPDLLHPLIVHLPLGLSILLPLLLLVMAWLQAKGRLDRSAWVIAVLVQALLTLGAFAALRTGDAEEERVEEAFNAAARKALHQHEEAAEVFTWATAALLVLTATTLLPLGAGLRRALPFVLLGLSVVTLALALRTGKAGGALVYEHQAAAARAGLVPAAAGQDGTAGTSAGGKLAGHEGGDDD